MTRQRIHGTDDPFAAWFREQQDLDSVRDGITLNDVDWSVHKYKDAIDRVGRRDVHFMMSVEVKRFGALPNESQRQTLFFLHQLLNKKRTLVDLNGRGKKSVWHFGYYVLSIPCERPDQAETVLWCKFDQDGELIPRTITVEQLIKVFRFDIRPHRLDRMSTRRHHKTSKIETLETTPLGFNVWQVVTRRS